MRIGTSLLALFALLAAACGDGSGDTGGGSTDGCADGEVEVAYFGGSDERTECKPIPSECTGGTASCGEQACISALYALCESPYVGVGCSDTTSTIVSCNP